MVSSRARGFRDPVYTQVLWKKKRLVDKLTSLMQELNMKLLVLIVFS